LLERGSLKRNEMGSQNKLKRKRMIIKNRSTIKLYRSKQEFWSKVSKKIGSKGIIWSVNLKIAMR